MTVGIQQIIRVVATYYDIRVEDMKSERQDREASLPRHVAMFLAREMTGYSYMRIGRPLNRPDHTTVLYAVRRIKHRLARDGNLRKDIDFLRQQIAMPATPSAAARLMEALL